MSEIEDKKVTISKKRTQTPKKENTNQKRNPALLSRSPGGFEDFL